MRTLKLLCLSGATALGGCVLATNGLDYNRSMTPSTEGGPESYPGGSPAFHEPVPFTYPGMAAAPAAPAPAPAAPVVATAAPAEASPGPAVGGTAITISNFSFTPALLTVAAGATVTWTNSDSTAHAVRFPDQDGPAIATGASYSRTFSAPGSYTYQCSIHPYMTGTVVVK